MHDWNAEVRRRMATLRFPPEREADIADELSQHLEEFYQRAVARGDAPEAAERATLAELDEHDLAAQLAALDPRAPSNPPTIGAGASRGDSLIAGVWYDVRVATRSFMRTPALAAAVTLTLALGIGATTAIFSVVYGVLLRPLPYQEPGRIMAVYELTPKGTRNRLADPNFDDFREQSRSFQAMAKYSSNVASVSGASQPTRTVVTAVSRDFFNVFRVQPVVGRAFDDNDEKQGAAPTALVSYGYWTAYLGASRDLSHTRLKIDGNVVEVIGVLPDGFRFPSTADIWYPADLQGKHTSRTSHNFSAVGRLKDGVSVEQANADISAIARRIHDASSEQNDYLLKDGTVVPLQSAITGRARTPLLALLGAVSFLLLVACGNVANLLLARASTRARELAVRTALGAARGRLVRQFVTEASLLSLAGGGLGVLGAIAGVKGLVALAPPNIPRLGDVAVSIPALMLAFLLAAAIAVGLGVFTATRATSGDVRAALGEGGRGQAGSQRGQRVGRVIVAAQMAITLVLVVGAGLFGRSLMNALEVNPGFRVDGIVTMDISLPYSSDSGAKVGQIAFYAQLIDRLKQIPGVRNVGATSGLPTDGGFPNGMFLLISQSERPKTYADLDPFRKQKERIGNAEFGVATDGYFQVLGIPLIRGRMFDERDGVNDPHAALVSESLARAQWPDQDPIGRTIEFGNMDGDLRLLTIVGVVGDAHQYGPDQPTQPTVYVNLFQRPRSAISVTVLSDADTRSVTAAARAILHDLNPEVPARFRTLSQMVSASLGSRKFNVILVGFFGIVALLLASTGVFGVMAYSVSRRTKEIGVRVALGATTGGVLRMIIGQGLLTTSIGVAIGLAGSLALTRTIASLLFGVTPTDPLTFGAVIALLMGAAFVACYIPARRATKVDPTEALKSE